MALTRQLITANAALAALTDEQIAALETLSQNDENTVIGARIGEIYRLMDSTIEEHLGVKRNGDEKTYKFLERAAKEISGKVKTAEQLQQQVATLTAEKTRLEDVIKKGEGNAEAAKQLEQATKDLAATKKAFNDLKAQYDTAKASHEAELFGIKVDGVLNGATAGLKFKPEFPASVTSVILAQAVAKVKGMNPEFIDDGNGGKTLVFKDANGARLNNPNNALNPYTAGELLAKELKEMGVLDESNGGGGGGTHNHRTQPTGVIDVSGCRTRSEAYSAIDKALLAKGLVVGSDEYQQQMDAAWRDNNVAQLPE